MAKKDELTPKQRKFADYYIQLGNATEAAIRAGYSKKSARYVGSENLKKPLIEEYISKIMAEKDAERIADQDEVLAFLTQVMRGEIIEQVPLLDGDGYQRLASLDEAQPKDRIKAAELLGKRHSLWTENHNISGDIGVNIIDDIDDIEDE
jgi:phage terminase small subunit